MTICLEIIFQNSDMMLLESADLLQNCLHLLTENNQLRRPSPSLFTRNWNAMLLTYTKILFSKYKLIDKVLKQLKDKLDHLF